jgi:hypothetical protein
MKQQKKEGFKYFWDEGNDDTPKRKERDTSYEK